MYPYSDESLTNGSFVHTVNYIWGWFSKNRRLRQTRLARQRLITLMNARVYLDPVPEAYASSWQQQLAFLTKEATVSHHRLAKLQQQLTELIRQQSVAGLPSDVQTTRQLRHELNNVQQLYEELGWLLTTTA